MDSSFVPLHLEGMKILQSTHTFSYGIDAVLLSSFVKIKKNASVLDLGTGNGIIPLLLASYFKSGNFTGIEILEDSVKLAEKSVLENNLQERINIIKGDLKNIESLVEKNKFSCVVSNPPYFKISSGVQNNNENLNSARHEINCNFEDICRAASYALNSEGDFYFIHKPERLFEIFNTLNKNNLCPQEMICIHPFYNKPCNLILVHAKKSGSCELKIKEPLIVYETSLGKNEYNQKIKNLYSGKERL